MLIFRDLTGKRFMIHSETLKYLLAGSVNTALMYSLYLVLLSLGVQYNLALIIDYACGVMLGFILHKRFTFGHQGKVITTFSKYVASYVFIFFANLALLNLIVLSHWMEAGLGQLVAFVIVTIGTFLILKLWVFVQNSS